MVIKIFRRIKIYKFNNAFAFYMVVPAAERNYEIGLFVLKLPSTIEQLPCRQCGFVDMLQLP